MKKLLLLTILGGLFLSCNNVAVEPEGVGFFKPQPGEKFVTGSDSLTDLWVKYIDAHNKQDMEKILSMESDSLLIVDPAGNRISGKQEHKAALLAWFGAENPKWDIYWAMPYKGVQDGAEWIIAGHNLTTVVDGENVLKNHMIDAKIKDGKVELFYVYSMDIPAPEKELVE